MRRPYCERARAELALRLERDLRGGGGVSGGSGGGGGGSGDHVSAEVLRQVAGISFSEDGPADLSKGADDDGDTRPRKNRAGERWMAAAEALAAGREDEALRVACAAAVDSAGLGIPVIHHPVSGEVGWPVLELAERRFMAAASVDRYEDGTVGRCRLTVSKLVLKAQRLWFHRLKLEYHKLLSTVAFNFNLRRYSAADGPELDSAVLTAWAARSKATLGVRGAGRSAVNPEELMKAAARARPTDGKLAEMLAAGYAMEGKMSVALKVLDRAVAAAAAAGMMTSPGLLYMRAQALRHVAEGEPSRRHECVDAYLASLAAAASRAALDPTDGATPELNDQEQEQVPDAHYAVSMLQCGLKVGPGALCLPRHLPLILSPRVLS